MSEFDPAEFGLATKPQQQQPDTFNPAEFGLNPQSVAPAPQPAAPQQDAPGFWDRLGRGFGAGLHSVIDAPAEGLAWLGDKAGITGGMIPSQAQTRAADVAARDAYERNPAGQSDIGYMAGQALPIMAAINPLTRGLAALGPAGEFLAGQGGSGLLGRTASGAVGGAIQGAAAGAIPTTDTADKPLSDRLMEGAATGGAIGGAIPGAFGIGRGIRNAALGSGSVTPERAALAKTAVDMGIPLTAMDIQPGTPLVKYASSVLDYLPFSGSAGRREALQNAVNRNVAQTFGGDAAGAAPNKITQDVMAGARTRIGGMYDRALSGASVPMDQPLLDRLAAIDGQIGTSALSPAEQASVRTVLSRVQDVAAENGGNIPGSLYQEFRQRGSMMDRLMGPQAPTRSYARDIKSALDDAFQTAEPERAALYNQANQQWRAMRAVDPEVVRGQPGDISPLRIQNAANRAYPDRAWNDPPTALGDLGDISQAFLRRLPESGTAPRAAVMEGIKHMAAPFLGAGAGAGAHAAVGIPFGAMVAPALGAVGIGRAANSALNSRWLANALIQSSLNPATPTALELGMRPMVPYLAPFGAVQSIQQQR